MLNRITAAVAALAILATPVAANALPAVHHQHHRVAATTDTWDVRVVYCDGHAEGHHYTDQASADSEYTYQVHYALLAGGNIATVREFMDGQMQRGTAFNC